MKQDYLALYTDYLNVTFGYATATGFSQLLNGYISHDQLTRALSDDLCTSKELWLPVKPTRRQIESDEGCLIFDDTIREKPWMDENELICWHYDPSKGRSVKGINLFNCLSHAREASIPVAFERIRQPIVYCDIKTRKEKRLSEITKNELRRHMLSVCVKNVMKFKWVLADSWFGSLENMRHIKLSLKKEFIVARKTNRLVALSEEDKAQGCFARRDPLDWSEPKVKTGWLKGTNFPVQLIRQVLTNQDGSSGIRYLAGSDLEADWDTITTIYQKRWKIEVFHNSLKSNAATAKSPARRVASQANQVFASIVAVFKMEKLKMTTHLNHLAFKSKLYLNAIQAAYEELQLLQTA